MNPDQWLADRFEEHRSHLRAVAYRMLGTASDADDAVQEAWFRLSRSDTSHVENLGGWLTTVVSRVCLDQLRSRKSRREDALTAVTAEPAAKANNPEQEAVLADSVGVALLVVLDALGPAERLAFVLHDMFGLSFEEIALIIGKSPDATRKLASRARQRVHGYPRPAELESQRPVVDAFLAALRAGDFEGLVAVLDPEVVVRLDAAAGGGAAREFSGARNWAKGASVNFARFAPLIAPAIIDGGVGLVLLQDGRLSRALKMDVTGGRISRVAIIADPDALKGLEVRALETL